MISRFSLAVLAAATVSATTSAQSLSTTSAAAVANTPRTPITLPNVQAGSVVVTQSATNDIISPNAVSCSAAGIHIDNFYYRLFDISTLGGDFSPSNVQFGVETATGGPQDVRVRIYDSGDFADTLTDTNVAFETTISIMDQALTLVDVPAAGTLSSGSMIVEIFTPVGPNGTESFFIGSNTAGQTAPSFIRADGCAITAPTDFAAIGFPDVHIVMNITGDVAKGLGDSYCASVPNSTGLAATITGVGSASIAANDLVMMANDVPNSFGIFFYGPNQIMAPFNNGGFLCVGGMTTRTVAVVGMGNTASRTFLPGTAFSAGEVVNFQYWFRDAMVGPDGSNTTDGFSVCFVE